MPVSVEQLKSQIAAYASGKIALGKFEDWFYDQSIDELNGEVEQIATGIDVALSGWHFGHKSQDKLRNDLRRLVSTSHPFVLQASISWRRIDPLADADQEKLARELEVGSSVPVKNVSRAAFDVINEIHRFVGRVEAP